MSANTKEEKIHWIKLRQYIENFGNGRVILSFQDGLPVHIEQIEGSKKEIDLTKENNAD